MNNFFNECELFFKNVANDPLPFFILLALIIISLELAFRELRCWYWKINDKIKLQNEENQKLQIVIDFQKEQIKLLETIISKMDSGNSNYTSVLDETAASTEDTIDS